MYQKIIHLDMDAFYASIEKRDNPSLKNIPVIVGGLPNKRGVVSTCSYEARKYGVHSAMPSAKALKLCKNAVFILPDIEKYRKESKKIFEIYKKYADIMEPLSLDEAFLDVTKDRAKIGSASKTAEIIKKEVFSKTGLCVSAGVSYNKFLAKLASDMEKPDGLTIITPKKAPFIIEGLPVEKFFGIGKQTAKKMHYHKIFTGKDILNAGQKKLASLFGKQGHMFYSFASGKDLRPVTDHRERKSCGKEITFEKDILDKAKIIQIIKRLCVMVSDLIKKINIKPRTITLKIRYFDFYTITRSKTLDAPFFNSEEIFEHIYPLLEKTQAGEKSIRLLGITASNFETQSLTPKQLVFDF
ncbi:MAG: DNA polymerase IV [Desulforegulaceae bacterium]|nr:DNA polymerase IV [Desulforegulaceae bacterium]